MDPTWEIIFPNLGWILTLLALGGFIWRASGWKTEKDIELKKIKTSVNYLVSIHREELSDWYMKVWGAEIGSNPIPSRESLLQKLRDGTINYEESLRLKQILEEEKRAAKEGGSFGAVMAIGALLLLIAIILSESPEKD